MESRSWLVPCDKCHRRWVRTDCTSQTVYDALTRGGRSVLEVEKHSHQRKVERVKEGGEWTTEDCEAWNVDANGKYVGEIVKMPRVVISYDNVACEDCRGSKKQMERV